MKFNIEYWYRYNGGDDKDFAKITVVANTLESAKQKVQKIRSGIYKIDEI